MRAPRHYVAALAALATAVTAALIPAAGTTAAPEPSISALRDELVAAIADERRALELLAKEPPRDRAAELALDRSIARLDRIADGLQSLSLPPYVRSSVRAASGLDNQATGRLPPFNQAVREIAIDEIEQALYEKNQVRGVLIPPPRSGASQCADGRDNDGDQLVDARYESGCTSTKDASEGSPLTCTLDSGSNQVQGSCSGTFAKIELVAPRGVTFDTERMPVAAQSQLCRYSSPQRLECLMSDGAANPRHVVNVGFKLRTGSASRLRALIRDFAGRARTWPVAPSKPAPPTADVDPVAARCSARFDFSLSRLAVRCDGADVKSSSASTGRPVSAVRAVDTVSAGLSSRCEAAQVSGAGRTAGKCFWKAGNKGKTLSFQLTHGEPLGAVTIHVLAGGSGEGGTTIVLRQTWRPLEGFLCQQEVPRADTCATL